MAKKIITSLFVGLLLINCFFITTVSFANENTISLGNEITKSIDKTGDSMKNVLSGNVIMDAGNNVKNTIEDAKDVMMDEANDMKADVKDEENKMDKEDDKMKREENRDNYDARKTNAEVSRSGIDNNTMTTWMWIALIAATTIIVAAIWYYVTQSND